LLKKNVVPISVPKKKNKKEYKYQIKIFKNPLSSSKIKKTSSIHPEVNR